MHSVFDGVLPTADRNIGLLILLLLNFIAFLLLSRQ